MMLTRLHVRSGRRRSGGGHPARLRRRRRRAASRGVSIGVNLAPMIDVTFLLLIFFLVTTTFERAEGILASDLPEVETAESVPLPVSPIIIRRTQTGPGHEEFSITIDNFPNAPQSFEVLPEFLRQVQQQPGFDRKTPVVIVAESNVRWDHVVGCWNAALRAGCERIAFGEP